MKTAKFKILATLFFVIFAKDAFSVDKNLSNPLSGKIKFCKSLKHHGALKDPQDTRVFHFQSDQLLNAASQASIITERVHSEVRSKNNGDSFTYHCRYHVVPIDNNSNFLVSVIFDLVGKGEQEYKIFNDYFDLNFKDYPDRGLIFYKQLKNCMEIYHYDSHYIQLLDKTFKTNRAVVNEIYPKILNDFSAKTINTEDLDQCYMNAVSFSLEITEYRRYM